VSKPHGWGGSGGGQKREESNFNLWGQGEESPGEKRGPNTTLTIKGRELSVIREKLLIKKTFGKRRCTPACSRGEGLGDTMLNRSKTCGLGGGDNKKQN